MTKRQVADVPVQPCHILAPQGRGTLKPWGGAYAKPRSLCGKKDPFPRVRPEFIEAHVAGYGLKLCPACERLLGDGAA